MFYLFLIFLVKLFLFCRMLRNLEYQLEYYCPILFRLSNKIIMSNIRDLQKLRGNKNMSIFAQTAYQQHLNPETKKAFYDHFLERSPVLTTRSPRKQYKETEDHSKSPSRIQMHRRGGSFGMTNLQ